MFRSCSPTVCLFLYPFSTKFSLKACISSRSFRMRTINNSLSTMSSPVTASSRSGTNSSPAPAVSTPASQLSQPVSLPDNNSLAQAISRALAESLPLLLSSLQGSSGGNTNMAVTSSPLSSASNSTQSSASLRSGTPCSTSQSSGMLVVPSFISTYSSFGGPPVVSTLPAMSSANLPVVVGGSCVSTTGSEYSTFQSPQQSIFGGSWLCSSPI